MTHKLDVSQPITENELPTDYLEDYLYDISLVADAVADVASADATDLPSAITLANEIKAQFNELLANLRTSEKLSE